MAPVPYGRRITELATADPDHLALVCGDRQLTRAQLESAANRLARDLAGRGVTQGQMVTIALPNSVDWFVAFAASWKLGAIPQPVSSRLPSRELTGIVELADPAVVLGAEPGTFGDRPCLPVGYEPPTELDDGPLPDVVSPAWKAPTSGGSTGRPKLIVSGDPGLFDPEAPRALGYRPDGCLVMPGPLYHNGPVVWSCAALLLGCTVVVLPRFDAEATLAAIERYRADVVYLVPTMMKRIWRLPEEVRERYDLSSLRVVWHLAEPCPEWLKQVWIDWLGPERIYELYAGTEAQASTVILGTDWLAHRGSVGRPAAGEFLITDADGEPLPSGEMGEVWMRSTRGSATYRYLGAEARTMGDGWESLGDMGWFDEDGYLYLGDRMQDMIVSGGANIYPAEVEAALQEHPAVRSCAVIGLPDDDLGQRVHALIELEAAPAPSSGAADAVTTHSAAVDGGARAGAASASTPDGLDLDELRAFLGERLVRYKVPRTFEIVADSLRDDAGKVRRAALRSERLPATR
jgi:bile acid-coenzyme A ligase